MIRPFPPLLPEDRRLLRLGPERLRAEVPDDGSPEHWWVNIVLTRRIEHPGDIQVIELRRPDGAALPDWAAGAHVEVMLPSGRVRAYSLSNPPDDRTVWRLGIKVEADGTGGSKELGAVPEGATLHVSRPGNNYPLRHRAHSRFVLCAGGIGVTVMVPVAYELGARGIPFDVHYSVKNPDHAIFVDELREVSGGRLHLHEDRDWLGTFLDGRPDDLGICACGPAPYMDAVRDEAVQGGLSPQVVYTEDFGSRKDNEPFDLVLGSTGERVRIEAGQTIARELGRRGIHVPVSCGYGICGACTAGILRGTQDARDRIFSDEERRTKITLCCSRAEGGEIVVDL